MNEPAVDWFRDIAGTVAGSLLLAAAWIVAGFWLANLARGWVSTLLDRRSVGWNGSVLITRVVSVTIRVIAIMIALNALGVSGTGLIAVAGAFTVAIGLSLQDVMRNFFAGVYLLFERPFKAGDRITIKDIAGVVQGIDIRTTRVRDSNDELVLIPNATVFTEVLRNTTYYGVRRIDLVITSPERRLEHIEAALHGALDEATGVRRPVPEARIVSRTAEGLTVRFSIVLDNANDAQNGIVEAIMDALPGDIVEVTST